MAKIRYLVVSDDQPDEEVVPVAQLPGYNAWHQRIHRGTVAGAVKADGRWFVPTRLVEEAAGHA